MCRESIKIGLLLSLLSCSGNSDNPVTTAPPQGQIQVSQGSLDFAATTDSLFFTIVNVGEGVASWHIVSAVNWLAATPNSGTTQPGDLVRIAAIVARASLAAGSHTGNLRIESDSGDFTIDVFVEVLPAHIGEWILVEGSLDGQVIANLTASFNFEDEDIFSASFNDGTNRGSASGQYSITGTILSTNLPPNIILNGLSFGSAGGEIIWRTSISSSAGAFQQYGGAAIGWSAQAGLQVSVVNDTLTIVTSDGRTELKYGK